MKQSSIINMLTYRLPGNVTRPIYLEYNSRRRELDRIWSNPDNNYQVLQNYIPTVETLLAISIFYRHVMGHMQGSVSFYNTIKQKSGMGDKSAIKVGDAVFDREQQRRLFSAVNKFAQIQNKYQLEPMFFEYCETIQFLRNCKDLFYKNEYEEDDSV